MWKSKAIRSSATLERPPFSAVISGRNALQYEYEAAGEVLNHTGTERLPATYRQPDRRIDPKGNPVCALVEQLHFEQR